MKYFDKLFVIGIFLYSVGGLLQAQVLEEVVVTAQKREQSMQDIGISITSLSGTEISNLGLVTSVEVAAQTPNLNIKQSFGNNVPQIFLRGVGINDPNANANGAVGVYVDEVNLVSPMALTFQLFDIERVEVLRGPQGTLYGRNTTGGAVNFVSRKPTQDLEMYATVGYGRFDAINAEGAISGGISENLAARASFVINEDDGFHTNRVTGNDDLGDMGSWAIRGLVDWQVAENIDVLLNVHGGKTRTNALPHQFQGLIDPVTFGPCDPRTAVCSDFFGYTDTDDDPYSHDLDLEGETELDNFGASIRINWELDNFTVTSITSYEDSERFASEDADASPGFSVHTAFDDDNEQFAQELRLTSNNESALSWIVGGFYSKEESNIHNLYDLPIAPVFIDQVFNQESESLAGFVHLEWAFADNWNLTLGGRYTTEDREMDQTTDPFVPFVADEIDFDNVSGKIGLDYQFNENLLLFTSFSTGFKSGGYNGSLIFAPESLAPFDAETLQSIEVGFKSELFENRVRLNVTGFYYEYDDQQVFTFRSAGGLPVQVLDNAASSEIYGLEAELLATPIDGLDIRLGLGLLDAEMQEFESDFGEDLSGNKLVLAPDVSFNGLIRYEWPLGGDYGRMAIQTDFNYQDDIFFDTRNGPLLSEEGYWLVNSRLSYMTQDERWEIAAWVKNLADEEYKTEAFDFSDFGYNLLFFGRPRTYGVEISYSYN